MNAKERSDFTQGSILKKMIPFMMPILGALILQAAYGAVEPSGCGQIWNNSRVISSFNGQSDS